MLDLHYLLSKLFNRTAAKPALSDDAVLLPPKPIARPAPPTIEIRLAGILNVIEKDGAKNLPHREICKLQQYIMNTVLNTALDQGQFVKDDKGRLKGLAPGHFDREINALVTLASLTTFSDTLNDWVNDRISVMAYRLARQNTHEKLNSRWRTHDETGRLALLEEIGTLQTEIFSDEKLEIKPARLEVHDLGPTTCGTFHFDGHNLYKSSHPVIKINSQFLKHPAIDLLLQTMVHEQLHSILRQLAIRCHSGALDKAHPLYKDAELMRDRVAYNAYISILYGPGYFADMEEKLCRSVDMRFIPLLRKQTAQRNNRIDRFNL